MNETDTVPAPVKDTFPHENLALGLTAAPPLLIAIHLYALTSGSYVNNTIDHILFPAFAVMLLTAVFGSYLTYHSPYHKSPRTIAARLLSMLSLSIVTILGFMLCVLCSGFGPA